MLSVAPLPIGAPGPTQLPPWLNTDMEQVVISSIMMIMLIMKIMLIMMITMIVIIMIIMIIMKIMAMSKKRVEWMNTCDLLQPTRAIKVK